MKITLALSALVALAATSVSAAPANSGISIRADPCRSATLTRWTFFPNGIADTKEALVKLELYILDRYRDSQPYKAYNGGTVTRTSSDKVWSVKHNENLWGLTLTVKGKKHYWEKVSRSTYDSATKVETAEYFTCIPWK
ncbi:hypothetical protein BG015_011934 [Linnemannia schmuckeri]|uniref:Uncharacterized protein n=1 Tax=Linnemannia schmuckeri TaxID=64567 RepID=A0A9P5RSC7_9FUNG|nr:hypothetical protein BG015_011934 [Linnemannia schmuckeri]